MAILDSTDYSEPLIARHPSLTLLCGVPCVFSHCCRIVLLEKDIEGNIEYANPRDNPRRVGEANPYGEVPTLIDRDLTLYDIRVIIEYLDERFPHPPLMPVDPVNRAKARLTIARFIRDWLTPVNQLEHTGKLKPPAALKRTLRDGMLAISPHFARRKYFMDVEYSLVDAFLTPLLWRLSALGIELPKQAEPLRRYARRMFNRSSFEATLSEAEAALGRV